MKKITIRDFLKKKSQREKIVMLTSYDYPTTKIISTTQLDGILVGDSLGMVVLGYNSTLPVKLSEIIHHLRAVVRANPPQLIVADMPFLSYEKSVEEAVENAGKLVKNGADAVKIEGGEEFLDVVKAIIRAGIPVMGHIGLTPQRYLKLGGYRIMGKENYDQLIEDAKALERVGVFSIVIENTYAEVAKTITETVKVPTICIGSGPYCDGQILVIHDLLGFSENRPYFAKAYLELYKLIKDAINNFISDVKEGKFPSKENYRSLES
ncbi:MAG: 3-methyl-2-oxobutanoate hydroxymethyltransferase [Sulfolobaceae archaeon]